MAGLPRCLEVGKAIEVERKTNGVDLQSELVGLSVSRSKDLDRDLETEV